MWIEGVNVLELPCNIGLVVTAVASPIDESSRSIATKQVGEIEAVVLDWHAGSRKSQGVGGVTIATRFFRAIREKAQRHIPTWSSSVGAYAIWCVYTLTRSRPTDPAKRGSILVTTKEPNML